jgi:thioredoxin reductase
LGQSIDKCRYKKELHMQGLPVAIIGAGPVGLAAASHLIQRGETPIIFEAGEQVGSNILSWAHVRMFSPWRYTVDSASVALLEAAGWTMPPKDALPTGGDLVERYLKPLASLPEVAEHLHLGSRVVAISRRRTDKMRDKKREDMPFILQVQCSDGSETLYEAKAVIDASGTWQNPNPIGAHGLPAIGETTTGKIAYGIPDILGQAAPFYANQRTLVVGSGHSAINALLELGKLAESQPNTRIVWALRGTNLKKVYGGGADDALPARGSLGTRIKKLVEAGIVQILSPFFVERIQETKNGLDVWGEGENGETLIEVDRVIGATGARPDLSMLRELRLNLDSSLETTPILAPMIDPNIHSCGTVRPHGEAELRHPEKNFYMVGMKSYGRAPSFLLATGYEQARSVVAYLAGDLQAAKEVHFDLPETGVCSSDLAEDGASSCCGSTAKAPATVALNAIPVSGGVLQLAKAAPSGLISLGQSQEAACCDDSCCGDGVKSSDCGCGDTCC